MFYFDNALTSQVDLLAKARYRLGQFVLDPATGKGYRYYHNAGADTTIVGDAMAHLATYGQVTAAAANAIVNAVSTVAWCAGIAQAVIATGYCGWFQTKGPGTAALVTTGNVAAGDPLVIDGGATCVGVVDKLADGEEESRFGYALAADSSTTQAAETYILTID